ncbi:hypothetical protein K443DRAFT_13692, partial [Laccaria amethystina LaAM-08-1]
TNQCQRPTWKCLTQPVEEDQDGEEEEEPKSSQVASKKKKASSKTKEKGNAPVKSKGKGKGKGGGTEILDTDIISRNLKAERSVSDHIKLAVRSDIP